MGDVNKFDFIADPQIRPFHREQRVDLLASDTPTIQDGRYVVYQSRVAKGQVEVVTSIVPYVQRRTDVGTNAESFSLISPEEGDGFFAFAPFVGNQSPIIVDMNLNSPKTAATASNSERQRASGITHLSRTPFADSFARYTNPMFKVPVPSEAEMIITFEILPASVVAAPIPLPFQIGASAKRVDFAGVIVSGVLLPSSVYDMHLERNNG